MSSDSGIRQDQFLSRGLYREPGRVASTGEDRVDHVRGDAAGERVLLAWVVAAEDKQSPAVGGIAVGGIGVGGAVAPHRYLRAVPEHWPWPRHPIAAIAEHRPERVPCEPAEADDHPQERRHHPQLGREPGEAPVAFRWRRLVFWRRAAAHGRPPRPDQPLAIPGRDAVRPGGEAAPVERGENEVAAAITGEHPAGPVATVRSRRQADDENGRLLISPAGNRPAPVPLVPERLAPGDGDLLPPLDQPRAGPADRLPRDQLGQRPRVFREHAYLCGGERDGRARVGRVARPAGTWRHELRSLMVVRRGIAHDRQPYARRWRRARRAALRAAFATSRLG